MNKIKVLVISMTLSILFLLGCTTKEVENSDNVSNKIVYIFKGEGDYWSGEYRIIHTFNKNTKKTNRDGKKLKYEEVRKIILTYNDVVSDLHSLKKLEYEISDPRRNAIDTKGKDEFGFPVEKKSFVYTSGSSDEKPFEIPNEEDIGEVTVKWEKKFDEFELRYSSKEDEDIKSEKNN